MSDRDTAGSDQHAATSSPSNSAYQAGCRCSGCRQAHYTTDIRWRVDIARNGYRTVPAAPVAAMVRGINAAGWSYARIAVEVGLNGQTAWQIAAGYRKRVRRGTAERIETLWADVCGPVDADTRRWPIAPLIARLVARYGSLGEVPDETMVRYLYRDDTLDSSRADRYATQHCGGPEQVWGIEWFADIPSQNEVAA